MPDLSPKELFKKYLDDTLTPAELDQLYELMRQGYDPGEVSDLLDEALANPAPAAYIGNQEKKEEFASLLVRMDETGQEATAPTPVVPLYRRRGIMAAAAILILLSGGGFYWMLHRPAPPAPIVAKKKPVNYDIAPGKSGAILTLASGKQVELDNAQNGQLAVEGNASLLKQDGRISYKTDDAPAVVASAVLYNTVTTPRGRQFQLVLSDGTAVWLNAASTIRFPTSFTGDERRVEITGEAYFEVVHNDKMPFRVHIITTPGTEGGIIEDIGTAFNVNAYTDEPVIKTTLVEGSVSVNGSRLKPGQQALLEGKAVSVSAANVQQALAWKNGFFSFDHADIYTVMRQLARWYDVDVKFEGNPGNEPFQGKIGRQLTLAQVLKGLEQVHVHFRIGENKRIVILP